MLRCTSIDSGFLIAAMGPPAAMRPIRIDSRPLAERGIVTTHAYNAHAYLYEMPDPNLPAKHCSRWDRLVNRVPALKIAKASKPSDQIERGAV
jgi:hypothetical protein